MKYSKTNPSAKYVVWAVDIWDFYNKKTRNTNSLAYSFLEYQSYVLATYFKTDQTFKKLFIANKKLCLIFMVMRISDYYCFLIKIQQID